MKENLGYVQDLLVEQGKEFENGDKTSITTYHSKVDSNKSWFNLNDDGPFSHEEADYRMMRHVADMENYNITKIRIASNVTHVVVVSLAFFHAITNLEELCITLGVGKNKRLIPIQTIARRLGPEKC